MRIFLKSRAVFYPYGPPTSCRVSEKSKERFPRSIRYIRTSIHTYIHPRVISQNRSLSLVQLVGNYLMCSTIANAWDLLTAHSSKHSHQQRFYNLALIALQSWPINQVIKQQRVLNRGCLPFRIFSECKVTTNCIHYYILIENFLMRRGIDGKMQSCLTSVIRSFRFKPLVNSYTCQKYNREKEQKR